MRATAPMMAEKLEVNERTIRSDIEFMRNRYEAPITSSKSQGYYYTDETWRLPSIPLTQGELFALTLGAQMLNAYAGSAYREELRSAVSRLAERLPVPMEVDLQQLAQENVMFRVGAELDLNPVIWQRLEQACQTKRRVWMRYGTPGKPESEREFDVYVLHISRNNPYVTGWCHSRQMVRDFRVDRIRKLKVLKQKFEVSATFDRKAHFERMFQHEVGGEPKLVEIWFDAATAPYIVERRWHQSQTIEKHTDGAVTLRIEVPGLNEVKRWVLFYGAGARVLGPPALVEMVRAELSGMNVFYQEGNV
ncbi:transcriptional regulator [filamentous cyanobacterium LEGE 11480]|uniref:Transcriptional regulator n=2 Tax=Romeriopsis TaxID=2992131 RepID=A0A928VLT4_9CYAN|nr:transcriptional regulator [Romeriopsis navalis LEGE 11480]